MLLLIEWRVAVVLVFFTLLTDRASTIPSNIRGVANPVRGLLDRKRSQEHHLQSSNESMKTKQNKNKTKTTNDPPLLRLLSSEQRCLVFSGLC